MIGSTRLESGTVRSTNQSIPPEKSNKKGQERERFDPTNQRYERQRNRIASAAVLKSASDMCCAEVKVTKGRCARSGFILPNVQDLPGCRNNQAPVITQLRGRRYLLHDALSLLRHMQRRFLQARDYTRQYFPQHDRLLR